MDHNSFKTFSQRPQDVEAAWHLVDAENAVVGRLSAQVAALIRGKHKPEYTPHVDGGDFVVIVNADKVRFTGKKETDKTYFRHSGYPGGIRSRTPKELRTSKPEFIVENAVKGMLPRTKLGRQLYKKLHVYTGAEHPHEAQQPQTLDI